MKEAKKEFYKKRVCLGQEVDLTKDDDAFTQTN